MPVALRRRTRGYALVTVLWMGLGLLLGASAYLAGAREDALSARAEIETLRALELARSGLNVALADLGRIREDQPKSPRDGTPVTLRLAEGEVTYRIQDENGKLDIGHAPAELLAPALAGIGLEAGFDAFDASNFADAIVARRQTLRQQRSSLDDVLSSIGMTERAARVARRALTTFNFTQSVNPRTAPQGVLAAIPGLGPSDVDLILARRATGGSLPRLGTAAIWLSEREGPVYMIEAEAVLATGARAAMSVRVIQKGIGFRGGRMDYDILETWTRR